jgi:cation:H+ antiporter
MKNWVLLSAMTALAVQWIFLRLTDATLPETAVVLLAGLAIFGAAFLLSWAAEVAQLDISQTLALAALALIAVLPEYAVDMYFAWRGGKDPAYAQYATANMTGANRLLIGIGWSAVVFVAWFRRRTATVALGLAARIEVRYLTLATVYAFVIPLRGNLWLVDTVVLLGIFAGYVRAGARAAVEEPHLDGPSQGIADLGVRPRRVITVALFVLAAVAILTAAEPFAESLLATGRHFGVEEFILVQWVAPLVSEAPELIVALLFVMRGKAAAGMSMLLSSKVNQWTLLVGMIPAVYAFSAGHMLPMPLDERQTEEVLLTAAQSLFAIGIIANLRFSLLEAALLAALFLPQPIFTSPTSRYMYSLIYIIGFAVLMIGSSGSRRALLGLFSRHRDAEAVG